MRHSDSWIVHLCNELANYAILFKIKAGFMPKRPVLFKNVEFYSNQLMRLFELGCRVFVRVFMPGGSHGYTV